MKIIVGILLACLASFSSFALIPAKATLSNCPQAVPTTDTGFCPSFKSVAICHCSKVIPSFFCTDVDTIYRRMIAMFTTIQRACEYQKDTTVANCLDNWSCYREGGKNSQGGLCSSTGNSCKGTRTRI